MIDEAPKDLGQQTGFPSAILGPGLIVDPGRLVLLTCEFTRLHGVIESLEQEVSAKRPIKPALSPQSMNNEIFRLREENGRLKHELEQTKKRGDASDRVSQLEMELKDLSQELQSLRGGSFRASGQAFNDSKPILIEESLGSLKARQDLEIQQLATDNQTLATICENLEGRLAQQLPAFHARILEQEREIAFLLDEKERNQILLQERTKLLESSATMNIRQMEEIERKFLVFRKEIERLRDVIARKDEEIKILKESQMFGNPRGSFNS